MINPNDKRDRVIKAAISVNKCIAEFGDGTGDSAIPGSLSSCSEYFDELNAAVYELQRFEDDVFLIEQKLDFLIAATKEFGQPTRSFMVEVEINIIRETLERWK